jgi:hypothetical protein
MTHEELKQKVKEKLWRNGYRAVDVSDFTDYDLKVGEKRLKIFDTKPEEVKIKNSNFIVLLNRRIDKESFDIAAVEVNNEIWFSKNIEVLGGSSIIDKFNNKLKPVFGPEVKVEAKKLKK